MILRRQFADLMRHGLRADYLSLVEKSNLAALKETVQGRSAAERLLKVRPDYYDAYVAIMKAVWPTTAIASAASDTATIVTPAVESILPNETARASGLASVR